MFALLCAHLPAADLTLTVSAGAHDRRDAIASAAMPAGTAAGPYVLVTDAGNLPVQIDDRGRALIAIPALAAGQRLSGRLEQHKGDGPPTVAIARTGDVLDFSAGGKSLVRYQGGAGELPKGVDESYRRGGYLTQVRTASGALVTDDYPAKHTHHHGIWHAWTKTSFAGRTPDFWNMGDKKAGIQAVAIDALWEGPLCAGVRARHQYLDLVGSEGKPIAVLREDYEAFVHPPRGTAPPLIELAIVHTCLAGAPLVLPPYHYGGIGMRGHAAWDGKDACRYLTSEGKDRSNGHQTRSRWCWMGGLVDGKTAGLLILDHPQNFRHPQPMRIHPDEPFFCYAPQQLGEFAITPDKPFSARYRIIAWDGEPDAAVFNKLWTDFAEPAVVMVGVP